MSIVEDQQWTRYFLHYTTLGHQEFTLLYRSYNAIFKNKTNISESLFESSIQSERESGLVCVEGQELWNWQKHKQTWEFSKNCFNGRLRGESKVISFVL